MPTTKVQIKTKCELCEGQAYIPVGEAEAYNGEKYIRHLPCSCCQGTGLESRWVNLPDFLHLLNAPEAQGN